LTVPEVSALLDLSGWTDTGTLSIPDRRIVNPATQATAGRKPTMGTAANGRATATFVAASPSQLSLPMHAALNGTSEWGVAFWIKVNTYLSLRYVLNVGGGAATYDNSKVEIAIHSNRSALVSFFGQDTNGYNGRRGTTAGNALPVAGTWFSLRAQFIGGLGTELLRHKLFVNGADSGLTYLNEGSGGTPVLLRTNAANVPIVIGNYVNTADATYATDLMLGSYIWFFNKTPNADAANRMLEAVKPT
jgi:hypothetical protein